MYLLWRKEEEEDCACVMVVMCVQLSTAYRERQKKKNGLLCVVVVLCVQSACGYTSVVFVGET